MKLSPHMAFFGVLFLLSLISGCEQPRPFVSANAARNTVVADQVVVDKVLVLKDGTFSTWKLSPGNYKLDMTANNDGATAEWVGGGCPKTEPTRELTMTCQMQRDGQLVVTNPTTFGLGADESVTVKLTKLSP